MKKISVLLLGLFLLTGCSAAPKEKAGEAVYQQITMEEAVSIMEAGKDIVILDVRTPQEYAEGHIPGAINVPNETIGQGEIAELPQKDQEILVYCRSGNRSKQASQKLAQLGYKNIKEFGGIRSWTGEIVTD